MPSTRHMDLRQKKFADEYLISGKLADAARRAGYSEAYAVNAARLLDLPKVKEYIAERLKAMDEAKIAKQEEVLQYLTSVLRGEARASIALVEGQGDGVSRAVVIKKPPDEKERLKAAELLGKRYGLFREVVDTDTTGAIDIKVDYGDGTA